MKIYVADAVKAFREEQQSLGLADNTVRQQAAYLKRLVDVCQKAERERRKRSPLTVQEIDAQLIVRYFELCKGGQGNRNNMLIPLNKFFRWAELNRYLEAGDAARLLNGRKVKTPTRQPKCYVPVEQFGLLLDSATRHPADRAVMSLALYTLCRQSEIAGLRLKHVDLAGANLQVWRPKKKRWTDIGICAELMDELSAWLGWYADQRGYGTAANLIDKQPEWHLVPRVQPQFERNDKGQMTGGVTHYEMDPLSPQRHLERVVKRGLDVTGAVTNSGKRVRHLGEGIHTVRRSGARALLDYRSETLGNDRALLEVSTMLDHEDPKVTLLYIGREQERERLNASLRGKPMYGTSTASNVVPLVRRVS